MTVNRVFTMEAIMNCRDCSNLGKGVVQSEGFEPERYYYCKEFDKLFPFGTGCKRRCVRSESPTIKLYEVTVGNKEDMNDKENCIDRYFFVSSTLEWAVQRVKEYMPWLYLYGIRELSPSEAVDVLLRSNSENGTDYPVIVSMCLDTFYMNEKHRPTAKQLKEARKNCEDIR